MLSHIFLSTLPGKLRALWVRKIVLRVREACAANDIPLYIKLAGLQSCGLNIAEQYANENQQYWQLRWVATHCVTARKKQNEKWNEVGEAWHKCSWAWITYHDKEISNTFWENMKPFVVTSNARQQFHKKHFFLLIIRNSDKSLGVMKLKAHYTDKCFP